MINREIGIMMRLQHPAIIQFQGYSLQDFEGQIRVTIIMNLMKKGSLSAVLENVQKGLSDSKYDNTTRQKILIGIARGMMYLHKNYIIHRDLKPGNILLDDDFNPHITDFGLSKVHVTGRSQNQTQALGTSIYMAPEVIEGTGYNWKADVYSFGILMYEVITDTIPYPLFQNHKMSIFQFNNKVVKENYRPEFKGPIKEALQKLIEECWSPDVNKRPTFEDIFNRLAFNIEETVYDIFEGDDEYKYYLEDVEVEEVVSYAYELIENEEKNIHSAIFAELKKDNVKLKEDVEQLKKENMKLKEDNKKIATLQADVGLLKKQIEKLSKQKVHEDSIKPSKPVSHNPSSKPSSSFSSSQAFLFDGNDKNSFCGIIHHLTLDCGGNVHDKGVVDVTASSTSDEKDYQPKYAVDLDKNNNFASCKLPDSWLMYYFKSKKVRPTHYSIRSRHNVNCHQPKNWVIEGSNTNQKDDWVELDSQSEVQYLHGLNKQHTFEIKTDKSFRYLRIRQNGKNTSYQHYLIFSALEFFGYLI